jgi:hypothetical protein
MYRLLLICALMIPWRAHAETCGAAIDQLAQDYGIRIVCSLTEQNQTAERISFRKPSRERVEEFHPALEAFLRVVGKRFIAANLGELVLAEDVRLDGIGVGGLSDGSRIIVCLDTYRSQKFRDETYTFILHHEFSSNVLRAMSWLRRRGWGSVSQLYDTSKRFLSKNLDNFNYSRQTTARLLRDGLLANYARTNPENDFNVYAEILFTAPEDLKRHVAKHPKVAQKLNILKQMYRDAGFNGPFPDET